MYHSLIIIISIINISIGKLIDNANKGWSKHLLPLLDKAQTLPRRNLAVAGAVNELVLKACLEGYKKGYVQPILIGDKNLIIEYAKHAYVDISNFEIIDISDPVEAAFKAVELVSEGLADILMKGAVSVSDYLSAINNKKFQILTGRPLSQIEIAEIEGIEQMLLMTDGAINLYPTLEEKVHILLNAVEIANGLGIKVPKVAVLSATELVNPKLQSTIDAQYLVKLNENAYIRGCIVEGPLSLDMAISREASLTKLAFNKKIRGDADILLFPNIESHSIAWKFVIHTSRHLAAHMLVGAKIPIIMTGRADDIHSYVHSMGIGSLLCEYYKKIGY